jgi:hypothetical protein
LRLHFDNSPYHTPDEVMEEISRFLCRRVPHPPYSLDLAISDFYLFGRLKERLAGVAAIDVTDLQNEVTRILAKCSEEEKVRAFDHWIERCASVPSRDGEYFHV